MTGALMGGILGAAVGGRGAGNRIAGPALVEEHASTTVVLPGDKLQVDALGNLVIEIGRRR